MQLQEAITPSKLDKRPTVAIGHIQLLVSDVSKQYLRQNKEGLL